VADWPIKPIKSELHHWWPRTLAEHWCAPDNMVTAIFPNGEIVPAPPGRFGGITNAHHMKLGGPWESTFEPIFNEPDNEMAAFVAWLFTLEAAHIDSSRPMIERICAQPLPADRKRQLARVTASLLARSPRIRHVIRIGTEYFRKEMGLADPKANKTLIALNQRDLYDAYRRKMEGTGRWAVLFSDSREFIAGDGFFHNFPASADGLHSGRKLVLPILPTAAIVYMAPTSHPTEPELVTLRVDAEEADALNEIVQVYSQGILFYRSEPPVSLETFRVGEYREFRYHQHEWLDWLLDNLSQYNLWGAGRTPGMTSRRPYGESAAGNLMLDRLARRES
jgi:hypothetical protein